MKMGLGRVIASLMLAMLGIGLLIWGIQYVSISSVSLGSAYVTAIKMQGIGALFFGGIFTTISAAAFKEEWTSVHNVVFYR
jgi:hypothetical protein